MGMLLAHASGLSTVAWVLATTFHCGYDSIRKRLREFYQEADAKSGSRHGVKRRDFDVTSAFPPLLGWILSLWSGRMLPLAIDVTNLGEHFHVLCVSVVVRSVAIPVAWKVLPGGVEDPWNPHWQKLLTILKPALPDDWLVIVLSDRGLESQKLFLAIIELGWHPMMRIKKDAHFKPKGWGKFYPLAQLVGQVGISLASEGCAYKGKPLGCTLLARWEEGYPEPWFVLTDLPPESADALWYGLRSWIEQGFKIIKGGMWDWQNTRMEDPGRVERLWLVMAVATLWVVAVGIEDEVREQQEKEQNKQERKVKETLEEAQRRKQQEAKRQQKQQEAQQRRRARKQAQQEAREQQRAEKKAKNKKKKARQAGQSSESSESSKPSNNGSQKAQANRKKTKQTRIHRVSRRGLAVLAALWDEGGNRLPHHLHPEPWPPCQHTISALSEKEFLSQQTYP
jgi:hypothetical protein